jgi:hypothetical protein
MSDDDDRDVGVEVLIAALRHLRHDFDLDAVSASRRLPDGVTLTITAWRGEIATFERNGEELRAVPRPPR